MPVIKASDIPGLREAIKRENDCRDASFLDLTTDICGVPIRQMTPRDLLILDGIGNPLMAGGLPSPAELAEFLWLLSPRYVFGSSLRRFMFGLSIRRLNYLEAVKACWRYIEETFQDSPGSSGVSAMPYAGWCAYLVNTIAINYGWNDDATLNMPLKKLFQYLKCIRRHHDPHAPMHNPSDKVKGDYIRLLNARSQLLNILKRRAN
jgi:hypothetical protein